MPNAEDNPRIGPSGNVPDRNRANAEDEQADRDMRSADVREPARGKADADGEGGRIEPKGAFTVWVTDRAGNLLDRPTGDPSEPEVPPNPGRPDAADIYFGLMPSPHPPPKEQFELQANIDKILRVCQRLYLGTVSKPSTSEQEVRFRVYYMRLFRIAQLGLEGANPAPEVANTVLASIASDLIDDEAGIIKNGRLLTLGWYVFLYSAPALVLFCAIQWFADTWIVSGLKSLLIVPAALSCFLLLWVGCLVGVWLSYGIRKTKFSLSDLITSDDDRLAPHIRLVFAGLLTLIIGMLFTLKFIELKIGAVSLTNIAQDPMLAFVVGSFCGISELALPASIGSRAATFIQNIR